MSFLRRGNSCVAPDMEIRKRLEVSASLIYHILHSFFVVFDRPLSLLWLIIHQNTAGSEIFWQSRHGRERKPDQRGMVQRSQLLGSPHNWVSKYFTFNKCRSSQRWRAVKKTYSWIFKTLSKKHLVLSKIRIYQSFGIWNSCLNQNICVCYEQQL